MLELRHEGSHVGAARFQIEHDVGDALSRPVIGETSSPSGAEDGNRAGASNSSGRVLVPAV